MSDKTKAALHGRQCHNNNRCSSQDSTLIDPVNSAGDIPSPGWWKKITQPFDSMPRDCNSFRITRFIQAETEASPSCSIAFLMPSSNGGSTRKAICLLPLPLMLMVDTWYTPAYSGFVMQVYCRRIPKTTPRSVCGTTEASNHNVRRSNDHG
ncbi:hypothetical protein EH228_08940 [Erwinia endophytica]|nr:hypothetical protein EH228_08940 [Erwinia endophytica]